MRFPRFRVRTLLIVVVLAGVAVWGCVMWSRSTEFGRMADHYRMLEEQADEVIDALREGELSDLPDGSRAKNDPDHVQAQLKRAEAFRGDFRRARLEYERAARRPWLAAPEPY